MVPRLKKIRTKATSPQVSTASVPPQGRFGQGSELRRMIRDVDLELLVQIEVVAEQGSFHKAALLLGVQTSTVSRQIRQFEARIGVSLFERHRHGVRPSGAGKSFLEDIRRILSDVDTLLTNARTAGRGELGPLRIGLYVSLSSGPLRECLLVYFERFPDVEVRVVNESRHDLMEHLNNGALDVVIVIGHARSAGHEILPLWDEDVLVALPEHHRLLQQPTLSWDDLRGERILVGSRDPGPELKNLLIAKLNASGDLPTFVQSGADRDTVIGLTALRRSITLLYASDAGVIHPGVVYRPITASSRSLPLRNFACWRARNDNPALHQFLILLRQQRDATPGQAQPATGAP